LLLLLASCGGSSSTGAADALFGTISSAVPTDEAALADGKTVILYFGDAQPEGSISEYEDFADLVKRARKAAPDADFALQCGDITNTGGAPEEWNAFFAAAAPAFEGLPLLSAPGNHEYTATAYDYGAKPETWLEAFVLPDNGPAGYKEEYYSFDCGDVHVTSLSANYLDPAEAYSGDEAENEEIAARIDAWIEEDLAAADRPWKIVLMHQPAYPLVGDSTQAAMAARWIPLFDAAGVDLVLCGHQHEFMRTFPLKAGREDEGGLVQVMGNASQKYYSNSDPDLDFVAFEMGVSGWHIITATAGKLTVEAYDADGRGLDYWEKTRTA
jgi:3',5'-cyclic AMP phosphodiesterase CpdA